MEKLPVMRDASCAEELLRVESEDPVRQKKVFWWKVFFSIVVLLYVIYSADESWSYLSSALNSLSSNNNGPGIITMFDINQMLLGCSSMCAIAIGLSFLFFIFQRFHYIRFENICEPTIQGKDGKYFYQEKSRHAKVTAPLKYSFLAWAFLRTLQFPQRTYSDEHLHSVTWSISNYINLMLSYSSIPENLVRICIISTGLVLLFADSTAWLRLDEWGFTFHRNYIFLPGVSRTVQEPWENIKTVELITKPLQDRQVFPLHFTVNDHPSEGNLVLRNDHKVKFSVARFYREYWWATDLAWALLQLHTHEERQEYLATLSTPEAIKNYMYDSIARMKKYEDLDPDYFFKYPPLYEKV